jgi:hypothetical protein
MGAYENPAQLVDKQSGQLIGQAIASIGQNLAKGMDAQSKVYREMAERRRATLKANQERRRKRAISINKDIRDTNKNLPEKATKGGIQSAISNIHKPIDAYSRLDQGTNTSDISYLQHQRCEKSCCLSSQPTPSWQVARNQK